MDTIRDRLSVGQDKRGRHFVCFWRDDLPQGEIVGTFPDDDEAWGVVSLILEYVERHGYDPERAVAQAMIEYREARAEWDDRTAFGHAPDPDAAACQDHAHIMGLMPNLVCADCGRPEPNAHGVPARCLTCSEQRRTMATYPN